MIKIQKNLAVKCIRILQIVHKHRNLILRHRKMKKEEKMVLFKPKLP